MGRNENNGPKKPPGLKVFWQRALLPDACPAFSLLVEPPSDLQIKRRGMPVFFANGGKR
jgi:hypothetical protein